MNKPYLIRISSQKGGVGKTTVCVNLATALSYMGSNVLLVDFDFVNPSLGFHMGVQSANAGVRSVLKGKTPLKDAIVIHGPTGMHVLPGEISAHSHNPTKSQLRRLFREIDKTGYHFVIIDTPPGFLPEENLKAFGEAIIVTTPETSACASAVRLANHYDKIPLKHTLVTNKVKNKKHELHVKAIQEMYDGSITAILPNDEHVPVSIAKRTPTYITDPNSNFSNEIRLLAQRYVRKFGFEYVGKSENRPGILSRFISSIIGFFTGGS